MTTETPSVTLTDDEVLSLARVIRDAGISGVTGERVGHFDRARAEAVLHSDWLAARDAALRAQIKAELLAEAVRLDNAARALSDAGEQGASNISLARASGLRIAARIVGGAQ